MRAYITLNGIDQLVNERNASNVFTPTVPALQASVSANSYEPSYTPATYTWTITPTEIITKDSIINIVFPKGIT